MAPANLRLDAAELDERRHLYDGRYVSLKEWIPQVDGVYRCKSTSDGLRVFIVGSPSHRFYETVLSYGWHVTHTNNGDDHRDFHGYYVDIKPLDTKDLAPLLKVVQQERE